MTDVVPIPTPIYRILPVDNLHVYLKRKALHAPNHVPNDGLIYKSIQQESIGWRRHVQPIPCGPGGNIHDYVPFHFCYRPPMLHQLSTGRGCSYKEGQEPLIYLVSSAQQIDNAGVGFVFSDGHGIVFNTKWYCDLRDLNKVLWCAVYTEHWYLTEEFKRRKQAEFLVYESCDWDLISKIGVINSEMKSRVETLLKKFPSALHRPVHVRPEWYY